MTVPPVSFRAPSLPFSFSPSFLPSIPLKSMFVAISYVCFLSLPWQINRFAWRIRKRFMVSPRARRPIYHAAWTPSRRRTSSRGPSTRRAAAWTSRGTPSPTRARPASSRTCPSRRWTTARCSAAPATSSAGRSCLASSTSFRQVREICRVLVPPFFFVAKLFAISAAAARARGASTRRRA